MEGHGLFFSFFLIFSGAAILATFALFTRQPLIIAYIAMGVIVGPFGAGYINDPDQLNQISHLGIAFLLFLLGLDMQPKSLLHVLKKVTLTALISSILFAAVGFGFCYLLGFSFTESLVVGGAMMFSSTIIGIKLLPTTVLHHRHAGEMMVGLLLIQDMIAIVVLLVLASAKSGSGFDFTQLGLTLLALPVVILFAFVFVKVIVLRLIAKFDRFQEYIFLLAIGWCLGVAVIAELVGLSKEMGAFVAGVTLATSPIAQYIAVSLKPLRDFFLVLFFFILGAGFDLGVLADIWWMALLLGAIMLVLKPLSFRFLLHKLSEKNTLAWGLGFRLGQNSEFSLLIAYLALELQLISMQASMLIQAAAIVTFIVSSYIVILYFPNPLAVNDRLRRD